MGKHELWKWGLRITAFWAHSAWKIAGKTSSDPPHFGFRGIARQRIGKIAFLPIGNTIPALTHDIRVDGSTHVGPISKTRNNFTLGLDNHTSPCPTDTGRH